jgi:hypothetical protein
VTYTRGRCFRRRSASPCGVARPRHRVPRPPRASSDAFESAEFAGPAAAAARAAPCSGANSCLWQGATSSGISRTRRNRPLDHRSRPRDRLPRDYCTLGSAFVLSFPAPSQPQASASPRLPCGREPAPRFEEMELTRFLHRFGHWTASSVQPTVFGYRMKSDHSGRSSSTDQAPRRADRFRSALSCAGR